MAAGGIHPTQASLPILRALRGASSRSGGAAVATARSGSGPHSRSDDALHHRFGYRLARYCPDFSLLCLQQSRSSDYGYSRRDFVSYVLNGRLHFSVVGIVTGDNSYLAQHGFQLTKIR